VGQYKLFTFLATPIGYKFP
jgi:hypothetical protein